MAIISISTGSTSGGDQYTIANTGLSNQAYETTFTTGSLPATWTDLSSGGTTLSYSASGTNLNVTAGGAGGTAKIQTNDAYTNFDTSVGYTFDTTIGQLNPSYTVVFCRMRAYVSSSTYASIDCKWDHTKGSVVISGYIVVANSTITTIDVLSLASSGILRIVRYGGHIQLWSNTTLILDYTGFLSNNVNIAIESVLSGIVGTVPVAMKTTISNYTPLLLVTFGDVIAPQITQFETDHIIGSTPSIKLPGIVSVRVDSINGNITLSQQFTYTLTNILGISEDRTSISISGDSVLRNLTV